MTKILVLSQDVIGSAMAGPGIRYWELAKALSQHFEVTLGAPNQPDVTSDQFKIVSYQQRLIGKILHGYDIIIVQAGSPSLVYAARRSHTKVILDAYDPVLLEALEIFRDQKPQLQRLYNRKMRTELELSMRIADGIICASEKQRDLWMGALMAFDRIQPDSYARDESLRSLIDVVPFGIQEDEPEKTGPGFRKRLGIDAKDTVVLWGGGIWNWFDPLTLIRAIHEISKKRDDIKLVFMGLQHPNPKVPKMEMATKAVELAKELGLYDKTVFFNFGWVPYAERQNYFLEADIGVSTHFDHLETRFSFRTRILDYLWADLPIVATKGDSLADLIDQHDLGITVDPEDPQQLVKAIGVLADDKPRRSAVQRNIKSVKESYRWSNIVKPIVTMVQGLEGGPSGRFSARELRLLAQSTIYIFEGRIKEEGLADFSQSVSRKLLGLPKKTTNES